MPHTKLLNLVVDDKEAVLWQLPAIAEEVARSPFRGDNVLVHCMAGVQRAAAVAVTIRAAIHDESVASAIQSITGVRAIRSARILTHFNNNNWNNGDFMQWLETKAQSAKQLWKEALQQRGALLERLVRKGTVERTEP